jgi:hypothetical protein
MKIVKMSEVWDGPGQGKQVVYLRGFFCQFNMKRAGETQLWSG